MCMEVPGDQPIVQFISMLDPVKMPPGTTITKKCDKMKMQVYYTLFFGGSVYVKN